MNMKCVKCGDFVEDGGEREFHGQALCEDCYMDALSPPRACDPWAVHTARSLVKEEGTRPVFTPIQAKILQVLKETGGMETKVLSERLQMKPSDLEREIAALRHMEKVRGRLREGKKVLCLW
jgi:hypothetical protein